MTNGTGQKSEAQSSFFTFSFGHLLSIITIIVAVYSGIERFTEKVTESVSDTKARVVNLEKTQEQISAMLGKLLQHQEQDEADMMYLRARLGFPQHGDAKNPATSEGG
jgi:hypothetical protein